MCGGERMGVDFRDKGKHITRDRSVVLNKDDVNGRARVTTDEDRMIREG